MVGTKSAMRLQERARCCVRKRVEENEEVRRRKETRRENKISTLVFKGRCLLLLLRMRSKVSCAVYDYAVNEDLNKGYFASIWKTNATLLCFKDSINAQF